MQAPTMLDVSSNNHNGNAKLDWAAAYTAGYRYLYVKATQGDYYANPFMATDCASAIASGFNVGVYHFFDPAVTPEVQASYFLRYGVTRVTGAKLVPLLDYEQGSPTANLVSRFRSIVPCVEYMDRSFASVITNNGSPVPILLAYPGWSGESLGGYGHVCAVQVAQHNVPGLPGVTDVSVVLNPTSFLIEPVIPAPTSTPTKGTTPMKWGICATPKNAEEWAIIPTSTGLAKWPLASPAVATALMAMGAVSVTLTAAVFDALPTLKYP